MNNVPSQGYHESCPESSESTDPQGIKLTGLGMCSYNNNTISSWEVCQSSLTAQKWQVG